MSSDRLNQGKVELDIHKILAQMNIDQEKYTRMNAAVSNTSVTSSSPAPKTWFTCLS